MTAMDAPPAISLVISDPTAGATILADRVTVRGTIAGPANVGVSVNGVTAVVSGDVFAAADVPLTTGQNIATATAAVPAGDVVATSIVVSSDGGPPTVELQASPTTGLAPLTVNFSYSLRTTERVQNLTVDFDGMAARISQPPIPRQRFRRLTRCQVSIRLTSPSRRTPETASKRPSPSPCRMRLSSSASSKISRHR